MSALQIIILVTLGLFLFSIVVSLFIYKKLGISFKQYNEVNHAMYGKNAKWIHAMSILLCGASMYFMYYLFFSGLTVGSAFVLTLKVCAITIPVSILGSYKLIRSRGVLND